jgi:hypothetical protein
MVIAQVLRCRLDNVGRPHLPAHSERLGSSALGSLEQDSIGRFFIPFRQDHFLLIVTKALKWRRAPSAFLVQACQRVVAWPRGYVAP